MEKFEHSNLNIGFYEFDQTKFMRPPLLGQFGKGWREKLIAIESVISKIEKIA